MNNIVAEKKFIESRLSVPFQDLSQSYLRAETALASTSVIPFNLQRNNVANPLVSENLLELNDEFVITHAFIGLKTIASDSPTAAQQLLAQVQTWEDPKIFSGTNRSNIGSIYNGNLNFTIDRKEFLPAFPVRAFRRVGTTQSDAFLDTAGTAGTAAATFVGNFGANEFPNGLYGFYAMEPTLINGRQTLDIQIDLGTSVAFDDSSVISYAVMELRGYLVVNAKS